MTATPKMKRKLTSMAQGFRQSDLARALRAIKSAGMAVEQVEIAEGKSDHSITLRISADNKAIHASGYLSMREACAYGKFGRTRAYELIAEGVLESKKLGTTTLVSKHSIDRFLKGLPRER